MNPSATLRATRLTRQCSVCDRPILVRRPDPALSPTDAAEDIELAMGIHAVYGCTRADDTGARVLEVVGGVWP